MRRMLLVGLVMTLIAVAAPATAGVQFPDEIRVPDGYFPEGISIGRGSTFYVGSLADGSVYRGDLRTGEGAVLTDPFAPFSAVGIEVDGKNRIWVAGGPSGTGRVYDGDTGALLQVYQFALPSFVNDVVVTTDAAYFTDSGTTNPGAGFPGDVRLFVVPLGPGQSLPDASSVFTLPTIGIPDIAFPNLNGIETTPDGKSLIVGHTAGQTLFVVDPATGDAMEVDTGGAAFPGNDGLVRRGTVVYITENAVNRITALTVTPDGAAGDVTEVYTDVGNDA